MKKQLSKIRIIFDIENWLWKSEIGNFRSLDLERVLIYQKIFLWKSAIYHSIKLPFDVEVAKKFLNVIYSSRNKKHPCLVRIGIKCWRAHKGLSMFCSELNTYKAKYRCGLLKTTNEPMKLIFLRPFFIGLWD